MTPVPRALAPTVPLLGLVTLLASACTDSLVAPQVETARQAAVHHEARESAVRAPLTQRAVARFYHLPPDHCQETEATIEVVEAAGGASATLELDYTVFGVCGGSEGLYYYVLSTRGPMSIDPEDYTVQAGLRWAELDTSVVLYDDEGGTFVPVNLSVRWTRRGGATRAVLDIQSAYLSSLYVTNPLTSVSARLSHARVGGT